MKMKNAPGPAGSGPGGGIVVTSPKFVDLEYLFHSIF